VKICNKKKFFFASETNTFHISYVESKNHRKRIISRKLKFWHPGSVGPTDALLIQKFENFLGFLVKKCCENRSSVSNLTKSEILTP
jgi:hypothetical protein